MKKLLSIILSVAVAISSLTVISMNTVTVQAADYATTLKNSGFPTTYIEPLVELHEKYPNWIFKPLVTNLDFNTAVNGERKKHSNQLIQKLSSTPTNMYCSCSSCKKNGSYVVQEASNWVSASKEAVEYYMDPRNFLTEQGIFQFESTAYDGTQTKNGVESILNGTWMYNSLITYKTASGKTATYNNTMKYSDAIIKAANDSGMSAYYLASKIRQEVGGAKPTAGGASGTNSTYPGIYNYYNIGAYTGATDGLKWASTQYYTNCSCYLRNQPNTTTSKQLALLNQNTNVKVVNTTAKQPDGYKWYQVEVKYNGKDYKGYIRSDLVSKANYGRPWTNPYLSIYNGAKFISNNYKTQFTGYLQKFNVNPASDTLYSHEYMANVEAAYAESKTTYNAYNKAGILKMTKTFSIPVFKNMPNETNKAPELSAVTGLKATSDTKNIYLSWNSVANATGYVVEKYTDGKYVKYATVKENKATVSGLGSFQAYTFRVRAYYKDSSGTIYSPYSSAFKFGTRANAVKNLRVTGSNNNSVYLAWDKAPRATGYKVYIYNTSTQKYEVKSTVTGVATTTAKITSLKNNTSYKFRVCAYYSNGGKTYSSYASNTVTGKTKYNMVTISTIASNSTKRISVKWNKAYYSATGYQVMWSTTSNFSSNFLTVDVKGMTNTSTTIKTAQSKRYYYVKVRPYIIKNSKRTYCSWSKTMKVWVK